MIKIPQHYAQIFKLIYRTIVKKFPPRLPKIKLPKINLHRRPPKTVYKVNSAEIFRPSEENKAVNYDVMIAPGNDFELVTNNIVEEPEYSFIVDMSGDHPSIGNNLVRLIKCGQSQCPDSPNHRVPPHLRHELSEIRHSVTAFFESHFGSCIRASQHGAMAPEHDQSSCHYCAAI